MMRVVDTLRRACAQVALDNGVNSYADCLQYVKEARADGLKTPVVFMGYYNPVVAYGEERLVRDCADAGVNGFILVDLPPEESLHFRKLCRQYGYVIASRPWQRVEPRCHHTTYCC
jgi:tryptophan synthase